LNDSSIEVQISATATLCNIVLDFSPMKKVILENNGIQALVSKTRSMEAQLKLNGIWALSNLAYMADKDTIKKVMEVLTYEGLLE
jgi:hypothetical protein